MRAHVKLFVVVLAALTLVGAVVFLPDVVSRLSYAIEAGQAQGALERLGGADDLSRAFKEVAKAAKPSVVSVSSVKVVRGRSPFDGGLDVPFRDPFSEELFERFFGGRQPRQEFKQNGLGSGVIVSADGHILTNNHVVAGFDSITVTLSDGSKKEAKVVGTDPKTDLAVIQVDAGGLQPAKLGDSSTLDVGEWVLALGNPFGLSLTLTAGIVSATGRANMGIVDYEDFIQTDAAINPGNSGGPLLNLRGEVVGLNTAIFSRSGGYMGIGFAIPVNMAKGVMDSILKEGKVTRGYLGVQIQDLSPPLSRSFGFDGTEGVLVAQVLPKSPAGEAGVVEGDIITKLDGEPVKDRQDLRTRVAGVRPGSKVEVEVFREGKRKQFAVKLGELESGSVAASPASTSSKDLGMTLRTLTPNVARELELDPDARGVAVVSVEAGSAADKAGVQAGDVILSVQGKPVESVEEFRAELRKQDVKRDGVRLKLGRGDAKLYVLILEDRG